MDPIPDGNERLCSDDYRSVRAEKEGFLTDFSMRSYHAGQQLYSNGKHAHAIMALKYGITHDPSDIRLHVMLIMAFKSLNRTAEAERHTRILGKLLRTEEEVRSIRETLENWKIIPNTGGDLPWTSRNDPPLLTTSLLGIDAGFGNQFFQYSFHKLYAEKYGMQYEVGDWSGRKLFGLRDPEVSRILPFILEIEYWRNDVFSVPPLELGLCDRDSQGYFQYNTRYYLPFREKVFTFFQPASMVNWSLQPFLREIRNKGNTLVAIHLRLGDASSQGRPSNVRMYVDWLKAVWPTLMQPVLYLATDNLELAQKELQEFYPVTCEGFSFPLPEANYYPDFFMMTQADILVAGNSTFSFSASMLNQRANTFLRPDAENQKLVAYDPWGSTPTL